MFIDLKYQLQDYLAYSWQSYLAVQAEYNVAIYPLQLFGLIAGAVVFGILLAGTRSTNGCRLVLVITGTAWILIGLVFYREYLSAIDWTAGITGWVFVAQGVLLISSSWLTSAASSRPRAAVRSVVMASSAMALSGYPLLQWLLGQQVTQLDWYGTGPVCTVLMTAAIVLNLPRSFGWLLAIPWLWSLRLFSVSWPLGDRAGMLVLPWLTICLAIALIAKRRHQLSITP